MSRLAEALRREVLEATRALSAGERVVLALQLGDSDLELAAAASGERHELVLPRLARQRQAGRRPSRCAAVP